MSANVDPDEIHKFERASHDWWSESGAFRTLLHLNPVRVRFIADTVPLRGRRVLDIGCGAGILSESLAAAGASVVGIDVSAAALAAARAHAAGSGLDIDYRSSTAEQLALDEPDTFDLVTCLEMLEHVPQPSAVVAAAVRLTRPGGRLVFATLNRTPLAYAAAVLGAEYVLGLLPRGTHDYARFIRPSELAAWLRAEGASVDRVAGVAYNPFTRTARITPRPAIHYLLSATRRERDGS